MRLRFTVFSFCLVLMSQGMAFGFLNGVTLTNYVCTHELAGTDFLQTKHTYTFSGTCVDRLNQGGPFALQGTGTFTLSDSRATDFLQLTGDGMTMSYSAEASFNLDPWLYPDVSGAPRNLASNVAGTAADRQEVTRRITYQPFDSIRWVPPQDLPGLRTQADAAPPVPCVDPGQPVIGEPTKGAVIMGADRTVRFIVAFPCRFTQYDADEEFVSLYFELLKDREGTPPNTVKLRVELPMNHGFDGEQVSYAAGNVTFPKDGLYGVFPMAWWDEGGDNWGFTYSPDSAIELWIGKPFVDLDAAALKKALAAAAPSNEEMSGKLRLLRPIAKELGAALVLPTPTPWRPAAGQPLRLAGTPTANPTVRTLQALASFSPLLVKSVKASASPLISGQKFDLAVEFSNKGSVASDPNAQFTVVCEEKPAGAECPVSSEARRLGSPVQPNQAVPFVVKVPAKASLAGAYRLKTKPVGGGPDSGAEVSLTIRPGLPPIQLPSGGPSPSPTIKVVLPPVATPTPRINLPGGIPKK